MADFESKFEVNFTNAEIAASGSENFLSNNYNRGQQILNNQSFNYLEIINSSGNTIFIDLDGLSSRRRILFANASIVISPQEEIFFNMVKITNQSSSAVIAASSINGTARIMKRILTPVINVASVKGL